MTPLSRTLRAIRAKIHKAWSDKSLKERAKSLITGRFAMDALENRLMLFGGGLITVNIARETWAWEGDPGAAGSMSFRIALNGPSLNTIAVQYSTRDGSAKAGKDYTAASGSVTFAPGEMEKTVSVALIPNITRQPERAFFVNLRTSTSGVPIVNRSGHGTILDDDQPLVTLTAQDAAGDEAQGDPAVFRFTRSGPMQAALRVYYGIKGTATNGVDYTRIGTSVLIPADSRFADVTIQPIKDALDDGDETVILIPKKKSAYEISRPGSQVITINEGDGTAPTAKLFANNVTAAGGTTYQFIVKYYDDKRMDPNSIGNSNIKVTGPKNFQGSAKLVLKYFSKNKRSVTATYQIDAPGGSWDSSDNGTYTIAVQSDQVKDAAGNALQSGGLGTFKVQL